MVWTASTVQRSSKHQVSARHQAHNGDMHHSCMYTARVVNKSAGCGSATSSDRETVDLAQNKFTHDALRYILPHCGWSEHIREVVVGAC